MEKSTDLQEVLRANVRVLLALRRMTNAELAARLDTDRTTVSKRMNGAREWALQDLVGLSEVFEIPVERLIGDTAALLSTVPVRMTGTETRVSTGVSGRCPRTNPRVVVPFSQVRRRRRGYHSKRIIAAIKRGVRPETAPNTGHPYAAPVA